MKTNMKSISKLKLFTLSSGRKLLLAAALAVATLQNNARAALIAGWDVHSQAGGVNNFGPSPLSATVADPGVTVGGLTRGAGVGTTGTGAARGWGGNAWTNNYPNAVADGRYITFTVSPNAGKTVSVTNINIFSYRRSGTGPTGGILEYQLNAGSFNFITNLSYVNPNSSGSNLPPVVLNNVPGLQGINPGNTITFRLVNTNGTSSAGTWYIFDFTNATDNDFELDGDIGGAPVAPSISDLQPPSATVNAGGSVTFTVTASGSPLNYYWFKQNGSVSNAVPGANQATFTLNNVLAADSTNYWVVVSNAAGMDSRSAQLAVIDPVILAQPQGGTRLQGAVFNPYVVASGTPALAYQWYVKPTSDNNFTGMQPLSDSAHVFGSMSAFLVITNLGVADQTNYFVVVTNVFGAVTSSVVSMNLATSSGTLAFWDFNGTINTNAPLPAFGNASALPVVITSTFEAITGTGVPDANDTANAANEGLTNAAWGGTGYAAQGTSNKLTGVQFNVNTVGFKNVSISYDSRLTATGSKYTRLQYTTNGTDFVDYPDSLTIPSGDSTIFRTRGPFDLSDFAGVRNNPNFGFRIVIEFENTATYGAVLNTNYVGIASTYGNAATVDYDIVDVEATRITDANHPPTITNLPNVVLIDNGPATNLTFTIDDVDSDPNPLTVDAHSDAGIVGVSTSGSGGTRTLTITPSAGNTGATPVRVTVSDGIDTTVTWLYVTVNPGNRPPTISWIDHTNTLVDQPITIPFTVGDDLDTIPNLNDLVITASSDNAGLIPLDHISFSGTGANRFVTVSNVTGMVGAAVLQVMVSDTDKQVSQPFVLMVRPSTNIVLIDNFDYPDGSALVVETFEYWTNHSGALPHVLANNGTIFITGANAEDVSAPLAGTPYRTNGMEVLYASFTANFSTLPGSSPTYFAHFRDTNIGGLGQAVGFTGRIFAMTNNVADPTTEFRLAIGNGTGANAGNVVEYPMDLILNSNYTVVARYVPNTGLSTLWVNPTAEAGGATGVDNPASPTNAPNSTEISFYAFREASSASEPQITIDNLKVGLNFSAVTGIITPGVLGIQLLGANAVVTWGGPFYLLGATNVNGPYIYQSNGLAPATSPYTEKATNHTKFYRATSAAP